MHASSVAQLCPTLCDLGDYSLQGSSGHGILRARILEWAAISSSRGSSCPRDLLYLLHGRQVLYHGSTWEAPSVAFQVFKQEPLLSELFYIQYGLYRTFLKFLVSSFEVGVHRCQNSSSGHIPEPHPCPGLVPGVTPAAVTRISLRTVFFLLLPKLFMID